MEFHAAGVTFLNHKLQGVPHRLGRLAAIGEEAAPLLQLALIESICLRAHLEDDSITACLLQDIELVAQILLILIRATVVIAVLPYSVHPSTAKFALGILCHGAQCGSEEKCAYE